MIFSIFEKKASGMLLSFLMLLVIASFAAAQSGTTGVNGMVKDQNGASIAGATVRLSNPATGFERSVTTDEDGKYNFSTLPPDTYQIEVQAGGFKKLVNSNVQLLIDSPIKVDLTLEPGDVSVVVNVTTSAIESIVNTQDASVGNTFVSPQITQLPTDLRRVNDLLTLQPGVTREGYVAGGRSDQANITLDGVDINEQQSGGRSTQFSTTQGSVLRATTESVEEFRITTTNANASQGRSSGAQISLLTKSGTNDFRGSAFYFKRPNLGSANSFTNNRAGVARQSIDRDIFGGTIGGPIIKDRFFFFYSYEGQRQKTETSVVTTVPLAGLGTGEFTFFGAAPGDPAGTNRRITLTTAQLNNIYTQAGMNPASISVLNSAATRYAANDFQSGQGDGLNSGGFRFNAPTPEEENTHILRLDYNISQTQSLFFRGNKQNDVAVRPSAFPDTIAPETWSHNTGLALGHTWSIGNNKTNSFRYGLTRQAFTAGGDANENAISFRFVYSPLNYTYSLNRITPVQNFTDDFTWTIGGHTLQFGGNIRIIRNERKDSAPAFDTAVTNPSFYASSGRSVFTPLINAGYSTNTSNLLSQATISALIGRYSQYQGSFNYDIDGSVLPTGTAIERNFATEEYDMYIQDSWKVRQNLTLNLGLRYALSRPVYEKNGFQVAPNVSLGEFFDQRVASAAQGVAYNELIQFELAGPKNDARGFYSLDTNNFQPRISAAWSPDFKDGFVGKLFGKNNESVFRGGFSITNDYFGQQLAVTFNGLSTLGFTTRDGIAANTYNATTRLGPRFTGFGQRINNLPGISAPNRFLTPADEDQRIESSLDSSLVSPIHYSWSATYGRQLPKGLYIEASYIGRKARNLLATRDIMALNNLVDTRSGSDWYTAAGQIYDLYYGGANVNSVAPIPYFENLFPGLGAMLPAAFGLPAQPNSTRAVYSINQNFAGGDWTFLQALVDDDPTGGGTWSNLFFHPQYAAFSAFSTVAKSDYHGGTLSIRQRLGSDLSFDFNYTFAKSMDDASGLQNATTFGSAFILNPLRQQDSYAVSDFDVRHVINANGIWQLPFGKGRRFFSNANSFADALLGGWQLAGIYRWNTGTPGNNLTDLGGWATNWNVRSSAVRTRPIQTSPTRGGNGQQANIFSDLNRLLASVRPPRPGETGDRNVFRSTHFSVLDMGLGKTFAMPWGENHKLQFRWEVFNLFNKQYLDAGSVSTFSFSPAVPLSDSTLTPGTGEFSDIQGIPRRMQFGLRYSF